MSNESEWFYWSEWGYKKYKDYYVWNSGVECVVGCDDMGGRCFLNNWVL